MKIETSKKKSKNSSIKLYLVNSKFSKKKKIPLIFFSHKSTVNYILMEVIRELPSAFLIISSGFTKETHIDFCLRRSSKDHENNALENH